MDELKFDDYEDNHEPEIIKLYRSDFDLTQLNSLESFREEPKKLTFSLIENWIKDLSDGENDIEENIGETEKEILGEVQKGGFKKSSGRPKKYYTEEEMKEAIRLSKLKYSKRPSVKERIKKLTAEKKRNGKDKIKCLCGGSYTLNNKTNHFLTKLHHEYEAREKQKEEKVNKKTVIKKISPKKVSKKTSKKTVIKKISPKKVSKKTSKKTVTKKISPKKVSKKTSKKTIKKSNK